jgi:Tfp pilus assembly protein PilN
MSTLTTTRLATLPKVNLLPPEIAEEQRLRRVQVGLGVGVAAAVGVVAALTVLAAGQVGAAQDELDTATAQQQVLTAKKQDYAEVPQVYAQVDAAEAQLSRAMGQAVRWSFFLNDLSVNTPSKVWLTKMTVEQSVDPAAAAAAATSTGPSYLEPGIGTVTFEGYGYRHNDVASWLNMLGRQKGLSQAYFTKSEEELIGSDSPVRFESQATVTEDALWGKYTQKAGS